MRIIVRPPARKPTRPDTDDTWLLVSDTWNDYGFRTLYAVYRLHLGSLIEVGGLKVMRKGQVIGALPLSEGELEGGILPDDCASIGASLDFYANLRKMGRPETISVLNHFRDVAVDEDRRHAFEKEEAFAVSLHRDRTDHQTYYDEIATVIESGGLPPEPSQWGFSYQQEPLLDPIHFRFGRTDGKKFATHEPQPERRSVILVGANGVGKTRLLASLARVAYTPPGERKADSTDGVITNEAAFPSIVAVAYSAFDDFLPPELEGDDRTQVSRQLAEGTGRYVYCGTRDLAAHVLDPAQPQRLLNQEALAALFVDRLDRVQTTSRYEIFAAAMAPVLDEISTRRDLMKGEQLPANPVEAVLRRLQLFLTEDPQSAFKDLSSGHKIVLLMLAGITASLKPRGIVLIDEPETHLHPPLLAALMTGVRRILNRLESYAIIATHSPVVAQETLASQIIVFEGQGVTRSPTIQTFGENVGALTREIFGLVPSGTDYRHVLERMAKRYPDPAQLEAAMGEPLSSQATAHVLSAIRGKD